MRRTQDMEILERHSGLGKSEPTLDRLLLYHIASVDYQEPRS